MTTTGRISLANLDSLVTDDLIDTVVVAFVDLQGRLMGKRVTGRFFLDHVAGSDGTDGEGIEACDYLLTVDVDMNVLEGFRYSSWEGGYGDFRGRPDLSTLRVTPWLEKTAIVLCDIVESSDEPPIARLRAFGMLAGLLGADDEPSAAPAGDSAVPEVLPSRRDTLLVDVA